VVRHRIVVCMREGVSRSFDAGEDVGRVGGPAKRVGLRFHSAAHSVIASPRWSTLMKLPRQRRRLASWASQPSIRFSQEALIDVK